MLRLLYQTTYTQIAGEAEDTRGNWTTDEHSKAYKAAKKRRKSVVLDGAKIDLDTKAMFRYAKRLVKYTRRVLKEEKASAETTSRAGREPLFAALAESRATGAMTDIEAVWNVLCNTSDEIISCGERYLEAFKVGMLKCEEDVRNAVVSDGKCTIDVNFAPLKDGVRYAGCWVGRLFILRTASACG